MYLTEQELETIRAYFRTKPVRKAWLFGSYARGEANVKSDVDLLVELNGGQTVGIRFFGWPLELAELLGKPVDLGSADCVLPFYKSFIEADKTLLYDQAVRRQTAA